MRFGVELVIMYITAWVREIHMLGLELGLENNAPPRGPIYLADGVGMKEVILQLQRTRDKGVYNKYGHYSTARKLRSGFLNV